MSWTSPSLTLAIALLAVDRPLLSLDEGAAALRIQLTWASPVTYSTSVGDRELLVRFGRALELPEALELPRRVPAWIENVSVGHDTLLLRAARDVTFEVTSEGATVAIALRAVPRAPAESPPEQRDGERRLDLLRAELLVVEGRLGDASTLLRRLLEEHPDPVPAMMLLAQITADRGRWRAADRLLNRARRLDPGREGLADLRANVRREHAGRLRADVEWKDVEGAQTERIGRLTGHAFIGGGVRVGLEAERTDARYQGRRFERDRGELYLQGDLLSGTAWRISAFGTRAAGGGGLWFAHPDTAGRTQVRADYRRPFWDIVEGITGGGTRDRIEVRRELALASRLALRVGVAANRYGLGGAADVSRSLAFDGGAAVTVVRRNPTLAIEYATDVESLRGRQAGTLPLVSREVHAAGLSGEARLWRAAVGAFAGYAWDRLGGRGPFSGGRLTVDGAGRLGADIWVERRLHALATTERVTRAGAHLLWRWQ